MSPPDRLVLATLAALLLAAAPAPAASSGAPRGASAGPAVDGAEGGGADADDGEPGAAGSDAASELFPRGELFAPLVADMRWPYFTAAHQWRFGTDEFDQAGSVGFGETFAFVRGPERDWGQWELGFQAAAFSLFDMTASSFDSVNVDYYVGLTAALRRGGVTTQARIYHQSSHLGDEYLIENGGPRDSVSLEILDLLASFEPVPSLRVYGGGGVVLSSSTAFDRLAFQGGLEWTSPVAFARGRMRPIAAVDLQARQQSDWGPDVAVLVGLRIAKPEDDVRRVELFARYYHGTSPEAQFLEQTIDSLGVGLRLGF